MSTRLSTQNTSIHLHVKHDSIDFTGLIAVHDHLSNLSQIINFDRIFYMHDTMMIYDIDKFKKALQFYNQSRTCGLQMGQSMNIGMYAVNDVIASKHTLKMVRGNDNPTLEDRKKLKHKNIRGWEGILFYRNDAWASYHKCGCEMNFYELPQQPRLVEQGIFKGHTQLTYKTWGMSKYQGRNYV